MPTFNIVSMSNKNCEKCKPDKPETHGQVVDDTGCTKAYESVKRCMKVNKGNVGDCVEEWDEFKRCFSEKKLAERTSARELKP